MPITNTIQSTILLSMGETASMTSVSTHSFRIVGTHHGAIRNHIVTLERDRLTQIKVPNMGCNRRAFRHTNALPTKLPAGIQLSRTRTCDPLFQITNYYQSSTTSIYQTTIQPSPISSPPVSVKHVCCVRLRPNQLGDISQGDRWS